jgi:hypothetical protein
VPRPRKRLPTKNDILSKYELTTLDKEVVKLKIKFPTITHEEIATLLDSGRTTITEVLNKIPVQEALAEFNEKWYNVIVQARNKAARRLRGLLDNPNPLIVIRACEQILQLDKLDLGYGDEDEKDNFDD